MDPNLWNVRMTMRVPSYYEVLRMFYFNLYSMNNNEEMRYLWTIPPHHAKEEIHILIEIEQIQQHSIPITYDKNTINMTKHITTVTHMVSDEPSMLYTTVNNDDNEVDESDGDDVISSQSESDDDNEPKEGELQTPLNPINPGSNQWFSSARYDYKHSRAFLDMGSGFPIDDLVESGTIRLLDWNDSMTDIQLDMRFVDKVQTISAVLANDPEIPVSNIIQGVQVLFQTGCTYKRACCEKWQTYTLPCSHFLTVCRENGSRADTYMLGDIFATNVSTNENFLSISSNYYIIALNFYNIFSITSSNNLR
ncbi:hypothetical protein M9H77_30578 [Catharanthus roseus]|uniref:Uncharacterized protein n=1 Tax=Catharanthus roseus TaxID=4058 RepID=A0ACB9ZYJ5_CATRO|nr:hypothetical protein M9H77_30578 [Catharanthus roseus]